MRAQTRWKRFACAVYMRGEHLGTDALQRRIARLERRVEELETAMYAQVQQLRAQRQQCSTSPPTQPAPGPFGALVPSPTS
jgi:hypothetical protein